MKAALLAGVALLGALAGCARSDNPNPNLLAPKLVVDRALDGRTEVYVHSAFGDRPYDSIEVLVDNVSVAGTQHAYSVDTKVDNLSFFLEVRVRAAENRYQYSGNLRFLPEADRVRVSDVVSGVWEDPKDHGLPWERILDREEAKP